MSIETQKPNINQEKPAADKPQTTKDTENLGSFSVSKAFSILIEASKTTLSHEQLTLLASAHEEAGVIAKNSQRLADGLALSLADDSGWMDGDAPVIVEHFASQFDLIAGLIDIGFTAKHRLKQ